MTIAPTSLDAAVDHEPVAGSAFVELTRAIGLDIVERGLGWLEYGSSRRSPRALTTGHAGDRTPVVAAVRALQRSGLPIAELTNRLVFTLVVLWVPMVLAWWAASLIALVPMVVWYVAAAPTLMREIWKTSNMSVIPDAEG